MFRVSKIAPLPSGEYSRVIARFIDEPTRANQLTKGVSGSTIQPVLTTPLMVALLVVRFRIEETVPANEVEFYEDLFMLLIRRHDHYKGAYRRERKSTLGDSELLRVFCAVSYLARASHDTGRFSKSQLCEMVRKAMKILVLSATPDDVVEDIVAATNLVLEEAGECRFVHRSVAEYHAARFIRSLPDAAATRYYKAAE